MKPRYNVLACFIISFALLASSNAMATANSSAITIKQTTKHERLQPLHYLKFMFKSSKTEIISVEQQKKHYKINFYGVKGITLAITNSEYSTLISPDELVKKWGKHVFGGPIFGFENSELTLKQQRPQTTAYYFKMSNPSYDKAKQILSVNAIFVYGLMKEQRITAPVTGHNIVAIGYTPGFGEITQAAWLKMGYKLPCNGKIKPGQWFCD